MSRSLPENPQELAYVHLYSSVVEDEIYLVNRVLSQRERPTDHVCYTIPEAEVLRFIGTDVMAAVHMVNAAIWRCNSATNASNSSRFNVGRYSGSLMGCRISPVCADHKPSR